MPIQKWSPDIWVVQLADEPALSEDLNALAAEAARAESYPHAVIDFAAVRTVNSSNLSQLLRLRKQAADGDAQLKLAAIPDPVWVVFMTTGLDKVFHFAPDVPTALAGLQLDEADEG